MDLELIQQGAQLMLEGLGVDLKDHNFATTPQRVAKVFREVFAPPETEWPVFAEDYTDIVIMKGHTFWTFCPHHMLPVKLRASVAYLPQGQVIGASKLVRMLHDANRMPMTQERLTAAAIENIERLTKHTSRGAAVMLTGKHGCFEIRGAKSDAEMVTCKFTGEFLSNTDLQYRFMSLVGNGGK